MNWTDESLKIFGWNIQRLIDRENLSRQESYEMFREVLENRQPDLQQGAFLSALVAKGETPQEIAGAWQAIIEFDTNKVDLDFEEPLVENSGTGMDKLKTFNVSTAAAVVAAAGGVKIARHGARALTSLCGTVDILEALGIDVECDVRTTEKSIRETGIGIFNGMSPLVHPQSLGRILSQIRFGSTLNIAASLASPCRPTHALRGVYSEKLLPGVSSVMKEIGYRRAMVVHGYDSDRQNGMDEISSIGESAIHEFFPDGREETYCIAPEDLGIKRADFSAIASSGNTGEEAVRFMKVISGAEHDECIDITCMNSGAILYLAGKTDSMEQGVEKSRELIMSGQSLRKMSEWISVQSTPDKEGIARFLKVAETANIKTQVTAHL